MADAGDEEWPFDEIYARPGHLIRRLQQIAVGIFMEEAKAFDITPVQYSALLAIQRKPGIGNAQLVDVVAVDRSTIGELIVRLEARGLVERSPGMADKRIKRITITEAGAKLVDQVKDAVDRAQERIVAPLPPGEREQFVAMLRQVVHLNNEFSRAPLKLGTLRPPTAAKG